MSNQRRFPPSAQDPVVIYTKTTLELIKACLNVNFDHHIATPHRAETNGIAQRAFSAESKNGRQHSRRSLDYMKVGGEKLRHVVVM